MGLRENLELMLQRGQDSPLLRFSLGGECLKAGDLVAAVEHLRRAVEAKVESTIRPFRDVLLGCFSSASAPCSTHLALGGARVLVVTPILSGGPGRYVECLRRPWSAARRKPMLAASGARTSS
jgi:hypothetical protein